MSASILTDIGAAQIAAAIESGTLPAWTQMALGDGGGSEVDVAPEVTALVNQVYIGDLNSIEVDSDDDTRVVCELLLDAEGDDSYTIREFGIYDADGNLVAYGSLPNIVKTVVDTDGTAVELIVRAVVAIGNAETVQLLLKSAEFVTTDSLETASVATADALSTARTIAISGLVTGTATAFDGSEDISIPVTNVSQADALTTARTIQTNLASTTAASFDGTANATPGVTGILPIANGGTGNSSGAAAKLGTSTVGSGVKPIYLASGTATASSSTVGGTSTPVYLKSGTITACSSISEASAYKKATNGYIKFANSGIIIQWGRVSASSDNTTVTFPITFPSGCKSLSITQQYNGGSSSDNIGYVSVSASKFVFGAQSAERNGALYWIAIGY